MNITNVNISNSSSKKPGIEGYSVAISDNFLTTSAKMTGVNSDQDGVCKENILVVDDQPESLRLLTNMLNAQGYEVSSAINGAMALKFVQTIVPDLLLLDITMPQMDGYELCQTIKANPKTSHIPVIFISALDNIFDKVKAFNVGGVDYITKPFQVEEVLVRIENQLRNIRLQKQLKISEAREREKSQKLSEALQSIQDAQSQFQTEKMSSLGRLVAGVAHEINNPINFIYGNLYYITQYTQDLLHLVELYQKALPNTTNLIDKEIDSIDLDFLRSDFPKLLNSMRVGAERISEIVKSLQNFTQLDHAKLKVVDLHEGIDSALIILGHRLQARPNHPAIEVIKEYGDLPSVECYQGQISQVFMNILSNAIDALDEGISKGKPSQFDPTIRIRTTLLDEKRVTISIADNGSGITEVVQQLMFDPFFTTKQVGEGTGLGLSISYQIIVEQHGGKLRYLSTPEQGAEFVIELPIKQF